MNAPLLTVRDLTRIYRPSAPFGGRREARPALRGVSLDLAPGEILGIVGASGCGKSTLARICAALDAADGGSVRLGDIELAGARPAALMQARRLVQMVFQDPYGSLNPRHRVGRIVAEPLHLLGLPREERGRRVAEALAQVGLEEDAARRYAHAFSGGQRQRIAIARAIVARPRLLVADEAVSALDLSVQAQILNLILDIRDRTGMAVLFISHDLAAVGAIADRIAVMDAGLIVETGPTRQVLEAPESAVTQALVAARLTL
jgi:peptide/nickel transport system ATP-binding protein